MAFVVIAGTALVPLILLPAMPFIWLAAVSLGVWKGYLVVQLGTGLGMSLSYVLGKHILRRRIKRYPDAGSVVYSDMALTHFLGSGS